MRRVIVTADDFGRSPEINQAIIEAHQKGILTCASLMVSEAAADEAVALAKANPTLKVGLHLVLVDGFAVLDRDAIPDLVDSNRRFAVSPASVGARIFFSRSTAQQAANECEAQVKKFLSTGLPMDHLNSHHHFHIHPTVSKIVVALAKNHDIPAVRLPLQGLRTVTGKTAAMAAIMFPWVFTLKLRLQKAGIAHNREILGLYETGAMTKENWLRLIPALKPGVTEIFCHPSVGNTAGGPDQQPLDRSFEEYNALLSKEVKELLAHENVVLTGFSS